MCIVNRLSAKKRKALLAKKPKIFAVWKTMNDDGSTEYASAKAPNLSEKKIHLAQVDRMGGKAVLDYKPGFHCFATRKAARDYGAYVQIFHIRKSWITEIGQLGGYSSFHGARVYVSKKITCDRSLLT